MKTLNDFKVLVWLYEVFISVISLCCYHCRKADQLSGQPTGVSPLASPQPISTLRPLPPSDGFHMTTTETSWSNCAEPVVAGQRSPAGFNQSWARQINRLWPLDMCPICSSNTDWPFDSLHSPWLSKPKALRRHNPWKRHDAPRLSDVVSSFFTTYSNPHPLWFPSSTLVLAGCLESDKMWLHATLLTMLKEETHPHWFFSFIIISED